MSFTDDMSLGDARDELRELVREGHRCPLCTQFVKVYRRKLTGSMAYMLTRMYRTGRTDYVHLPSLREGDGSMDTTMAQYWGLIEEEKARRPDGGRAGWWRITALGERFVRVHLRVPKYALVYDGRCLGMDGDLVSIIDCLGDKFDYRELMDG